MNITVVDHPLAARRLTNLRDKNTDSAGFRQALRELSNMLVYEATRTLPVEVIDIETPIQPTEGVRLSSPPILVPILRAGLGMAEAALELMPEAIMGFIGLARDEQTFQPKSYLAALPKRLDGRTVIVLDPMLATGGSLDYTCQLLAERGVSRQIVVCVLAAPEGIERLERSGLVLEIVTASIDEKLNDKAYIVPGLGDAGDRQFGEF
ncbi:MAG: uracil phosphoribosyltransferase [Frankiaceae bacterium]|nr:uracil phosphoribosyltransferase [Frankiaceae bacterium]